MRMVTNYNENLNTKIMESETKKQDKPAYGPQVIYPKLSYDLNGILFKVHRELGCFAREKQYGDAIAKKLLEEDIKFEREVSIAGTGNILDFVIEGKIILEIKSERFITKDNYRQVQNYLQQADLKLGILANFRQKFLKPIRIIRIENNFSHE